MRDRIDPRIVRAVLLAWQIEVVQQTAFSGDVNKQTEKIGAIKMQDLKDLVEM